nr:Ig-like domain-containing protein [Nostocaceae cyanobacterium]
VTLPETFASDDFNSANLNPIWTFADPVGDSNYALTGVGTEDAYLELAVAGGNSHDMWFSQNQAVRVMQGTANEDFTAEVKFESQPSQGYQIQGILVQEDANNWLRFDVYHDGSTQNIFAAATNSGNSGVKINSSISFADASYLRVNRQGNTWTLDYSGDGITWTNAGNFNHTINVSEIGVFAGNAGGNSPAYTAVVDYFFNTATPIVPEDVAPANQPPVANDDIVSVEPGETKTLDILSNDTDSDGSVAPSTITIIDQPLNGTVIPNNDGTVTYSHNGSATTSDTFTYTVADNDGDISNTATVNLTIAPNQAPTANNDTAVVTTGDTLTINILNNDTDSDGNLDLTTLTIASQPSSGSVTVNPDGTITYTHNGSATTTDTFTYTVADDDADPSNIATVDITVTPNQVPVANNDSASVTSGGAIAINVLNNDSDSDGTLNPNTVNITSQPSNGSVIVNSNGTITYTHNGSATTPDTFTYTVADNDGSTSNPATVDVNIITQSSGGPFIDLWHGSVQEFGQNGQPQNWINILGNVNDPDGVASLSYSLNGSSPVSLNYQANGLRLANNGDFNVDIAYSLLDGSAVDDIVTITAVDELGNVSTQTVTVDYQTPTSVSENYSIDWNSVNNPLDVGQPIDGKWGIEGDGIRTLETGYDRLYGFGDISWDNYEVEAAITINQFNFAGGSGVGFLLRWNGHTDNSDDPQDLEQPIAGFYPLGGIGWYTGNGLQIFTDDGKNSAAKSLQEGNTYIFKMRVEDVESTDRTLYSLKVWDEGEAEPTNWDVQESSSSGPDSGGAVLIAHRNDVTFGDVTVTPISGSANQFSSQNSTSNNTNNTSTNNGETQSSTIRINAGGNEYTDVFGRHWLADTYYNGGKVHNAGLEANADTSEVSLYGTERWEPQFSYQIPVANGTYDVNLSWLENYHNTIGDRLIDVVIEGQLVQDNLDVFAEVGLNKLLTKSFQDIQITDGELTIEFIDQSPDSNAFVLAIEILPDSGTIPSKTIIADTNSNTLSATEGDDTLIGVNPNASNPGQGEIDTFTGLGGADTFVLGDTIQTYYDDGLINTAGVDDYALISDFNIEQQDVIQLSGTSTDYLLGTSPNGLANGQGIFRQVSGQENELIGIVEGVTGLTLNSPSFQFV